MPIETRYRGAFIMLDSDFKLESFQVLREKVFLDDEGNILNRESDNSQTTDGFSATDLLADIMPDLAEIVALKARIDELEGIILELTA